MKKLMIAAAAVAMASSVFAAGYTFTATLKTTASRMGVASPDVLRLGWSTALNQFWYEDPSVTTTLWGIGQVPEGEIAIPAAYLKFHTVRGERVPALRKTSTNEGTVENTTGVHPMFLLNVDGNYNAVLAQVAVLAARYAEPTPGIPGQVYCDSIRVVRAADCYRVAGTKRISVNFIEGRDLTDCCDVPAVATVVRGETYAFDNTASTGGVNPTIIGYDLWETDGVPAVNSTLYQRFGAQESERANSVEMFARVVSSVTTDGSVFAGWIAGQGTVLTAGQMAPRMVMGNIVGALEAPQCVSCCVRPQPALVFDCTIPTGWYAPLTAAYGTFQLMYNANLR